MVLDDFCAWLMLIQFVQMTFAALIVKPFPCEPGLNMRQASYFLGPVSIDNVIIILFTIINYV